MMGCPRFFHFSHFFALTLAASVVSAEPIDIQASAGTPEASFDDMRYRLGYDVYLANKNLPAAWQVAAKAVAAAPTSS